MAPNPMRGSDNDKRPFASDLIENQGLSRTECSDWGRRTEPPCAGLSPKFTKQTGGSCFLREGNTGWQVAGVEPAVRSLPSWAVKWGFLPFAELEKPGMTIKLFLRWLWGRLPTVCCIYDVIAWTPLNLRKVVLLPPCWDWCPREKNLQAPLCGNWITDIENHFHPALKRMLFPCAHIFSAFHLL